MAGLLVDMAVGETISIGSAVVSFLGHRGRRVRLRVEAPQDLKVEIKKPQTESS
jgi:sRNA-binding carbon storage regulator CsrA